MFLVLCHAECQALRPGNQRKFSLNCNHQVMEPPRMPNVNTIILIRWWLVFDLWLSCWYYKCCWCPYHVILFIASNQISYIAFIFYLSCSLSFVFEHFLVLSLLSHRYKNKCYWSVDNIASIILIFVKNIEPNKSFRVE